MTKTYRGALVLVVVGALLVPATASAAVPAGVTKGLDYLHASQRTDGGFSYGSVHGNTSDTPWAMLAITAGGNNPARWQVDERSPITFLQDTNLESAAKSSGNVPEYYALCILAYRAANRTDLLSSAGSTQIDLVGRLMSYQYPTYGYYSPGEPATTAAATETTAWAILGLIAAHQSGPPVSSAVAWLQTAAQNNGSGGGPNADGGFGSQPNFQSSTTITSLVVQALVSAGVSPAGKVVQGAAGFIESMQLKGGGFQDTQSGFANAPSTGWAIEGLRAGGVDPHKLVLGGRSPYTFLSSLRQKNGSYFEFPSDIGDVMGATIQATIALGNKTLPIPHGPDVLTHFDPRFVTGTVAPKNGARFASATVLVKAAYRDNLNGTGVKASAISVTLDGKSKTKAAHITASHLRLQLTKLADGSHTLVITVHDWAGNAVRVERSFTVAVPTGGGGSSTGGGTHPGGSGEGSGGGSGGEGTGGGGTTVHHTASPTPRATISSSPTVSPGITLTPTPSSSFPNTLTSPSPSASVTGQAAGSSGSGGGGNTAAVVGATLAVLVPLGFAGSWLVRRHLMGVMGGASRGEILPRGSSVWRRFWKSSGGPPPPAGGGE